jgi:hypothetical protein
MRARSSSALAVALGMISGVGACTPPTFRPLHPRRVEADGQVVEIARTDLRRSVVEVDVRGPAPSGLDGAWVWTVGAIDGAPCGRRLAASSVAPTSAAGSQQAFAAQFDRTLLDRLEGPSTLEVRVKGAGGDARCVSLPLSGPEPELRWTLDPWGENRPFVGKTVTLWFPLGATRYASGADLLVVRLGRWWGPVRLGAGTGVGFTCCARDDPNAAFTIPVTAGAEIFPVVSGHFALGLDASYAVRPSWFDNDSSRGFRLIHGPVGSLELAYIPHPLNWFLEGPRSGTIGLSFSVGRWLPDGGVTVLGASLSIN